MTKSDIFFRFFPDEIKRPLTYIVLSLYFQFIDRKGIPPVQCYHYTVLLAYYYYVGSMSPSTGKQHCRNHCQSTETENAQDEMRCVYSKPCAVCVYLGLCGFFCLAASHVVESIPVNWSSYKYNSQQHLPLLHIHNIQWRIIQLWAEWVPPPNDQNIGLAMAARSSLPQTLWQVFIKILNFLSIFV